MSRSEEYRLGVTGVDMVDLHGEFDRAWRNRSQEHRQHLADAGITFQAMLRAGDLGVERISTTGRLYMPSPDGFPAVILAIWSPAPPSNYCAVEDPEIVDLIAFRTDVPDKWWYRVGEPGLMLGEDHYLAAATEGVPLKVFDSPFAWLQGNCEGACILDDTEARWANERIADDDAALDEFWRAA